MVPELRKVAQLNIKWKKKWVPLTDVCTGAPPGKVTALRRSIIPLLSSGFSVLLPEAEDRVRNEITVRSNLEEKYGTKSRVVFSGVLRYMDIRAQNNLGGHQIFARKICHCN